MPKKKLKIYKEDIILEKILDLIFPQVCGFCGKLDKNSLCKQCENKIEKLKRVQLRSGYEYNHMYIFKYEGIIRDKIIDYKFNDKSYLYKTFSKITLNDKIICNFVKGYDIIIPVPIHRKRRMERGYNQSELIIKEVGKNLNIKVENKILVKVKNTPKQSLLNKENRDKNVANTYDLKIEKSSEIYDKKVLLFDDILTTGNTAKECIKTINMAKPLKVDVLTIAKD